MRTGKCFATAPVRNLAKGAEDENCLYHQVGVTSRQVLCGDNKGRE